MGETPARPSVSRASARVVSSLVAAAEAMASPCEGLPATRSAHSPRRATAAPIRDLTDAATG